MDPSSICFRRLEPDSWYLFLGPSCSNLWGFLCSGIRLSRSPLLVSLQLYVWLQGRIHRGFVGFSRTPLTQNFITWEILDKFGNTVFPEIFTLFTLVRLFNKSIILPLNACKMVGWVTKQFRLWSDAPFCGVWSVSIPSAQACLPESAE